MTGADTPTNPTPPTETAAATPARKGLRRDAVVGAACGLVVALMVGAAYASVPLYDWFCRVTGFNGTTQRATVMPSQTLARKIAVRFDSNISGGLPWKFQPEKTEIEVHIGEVVTAYYKVTNQAARTTTGVASYNVAPLTAGGYFQKINCFCFTEQTMAPGETREMAVVFYVDEALTRDVDEANINTITLSYTFYPAKETQAKPVAEVKSERRGGNL